MFEKEVQSIPLCTGSGVRVAILDSGVNPQMPLLKKKSFRVFDCLYNESGLKIQALSNQNVTDRNGHGSFVQSCVYAAAPDVEVDHFRLLDRNNVSDGVLLCHVLDFVISENYHVVNLSLGTRNEQHIPWLVTIMKRAYERNVTIVAANSNVGNSLYPARFTYCISVDGMPARNPLQLRYKPNSVIEFEGWGVNVPMPSLDEKLTYLTGSSYAAGHVTGIVARAIEMQGKNYSHLDTKIILREYATAFERTLGNSRLHA